MKKKNLVMGVFVATLVLLLGLQPAYAEASEIFANTPTDTVSAVLMLTLIPLWIVVGKLAKRALGE